MPTFPKKTSGPKVVVPSSIGPSLTTSKPSISNTKTCTKATRMSACK